MPDEEQQQDPQADAPEAAETPDAPESPDEATSETADAGSLAEEALAAANEALSAFDPNEPLVPESDPMAEAMSEAAASGGGDGAQAFTAETFDGIGVQRDMPEGLDLLSDVNLNVKIELGRTRMLVEDVLRLNSGSVVELDKLAGDPVDIYVNDRPVARGEVLVLNDNFCVRISEIISRVEDDDADNGAAA
jgi:flagellar motor switch protein FliN/FliY